MSVEVGWVSQIYIFFSIGDLGKIIDLELNCLGKAINWPRSSFGRVLSFECRSFQIWGSKGQIRAILGQTSNIDLWTPILNQKWKFQKSHIQMAFLKQLDIQKKVCKNGQKRDIYRTQLWQFRIQIEQLVGGNLLVSCKAA